MANHLKDTTVLKQILPQLINSVINNPNIDDTLLETCLELCTIIVDTYKDAQLLLNALFLPVIKVMNDSTDNAVLQVFLIVLKIIC